MYKCMAHGYIQLSGEGLGERAGGTEGINGVKGDILLTIKTFF